MPIRDREDAVEVEARIKSIFGAPPAGRAAAVRELFVEALDFNADQGHVALPRERADVELPDTAERVAVLDGVHVLYVALDAPESGRVNAREATAAARLIADQLGDDLLLVFSNTDASQLHFVLPGLRRTLRRLVFDHGQHNRTAVQQVSNIYRRPHDTRSIREALDQAFDVERVTKRFFEEYDRIFKAAKERVTGFDDDEDRHLFVQTHFNRLMFVHFLSRKGWLTFNGDKDYLNALWKARPEANNFHRDRLRPLFFRGLNVPREDRDADFESLCGDVPFLNGGLFEETVFDTQASVPDEAIEPLLFDLFDKFNFTVMESTPFDIEVAVDPEMLGKVFEELVTGRHESGSYYTPRPVVSFMCREALKGYLEGATGLDSDAIARFVDERDAAGIPLPEARAVSEALHAVAVVDPACGSGAYLLGMMQELIELWSALYSGELKNDARERYDLKLDIIQRNLHGVDIDAFAVNIAMLRMWLSLAIEYDGDSPEPLPNLDFKVMCGDSLLGPDPGVGAQAAREDASAQVSLGREPARMRKLDDLKADYMRAIASEEKQRLRTEIDAIRERLREALGDASTVPAGSVDWRVEFAEVFADGGFDIAITNPPYIDSTTMTKRDPQERHTLTVQYTTTTGNWDYYIPFWERSLQLVRPGAVAVLITPNKWLSAPYGKGLRSLAGQKVSMIADLSTFRVFHSSGVFPVIVFARNMQLESVVQVLKFSDPTTVSSTTSVSRSSITRLTNWGVALSEHAKELVSWMESRRSLDQICAIHGAFTVREAYELTDLILDYHEDSEATFRLINTGTIDPFRSLWGQKKTRYLGSVYDRPLIPKRGFASAFPRRHSQMTSPKIIVGGIGKLEAFFDEDGTYVAGKSNRGSQRLGARSLALVFACHPQFRNNPVFHA